LNIDSLEVTKNRILIKGGGVFSLSRGVCKIKTPSVLYENYREIHVYCVWRKGEKGE
jgi:hypothetical protein